MVLARLYPLSLAIFFARGEAFILPFELCSAIWVAVGADVWKDLLDKGVLIRDVGLEGYLRVTIGNEAENNKFLSALKDVLNK